VVRNCGRRRVSIFRLHRMHEMQTIVTDVFGVCQSVTRFNSASLRKIG